MTPSSPNPRPAGPGVGTGPGAGSTVDLLAVATEAALGAGRLLLDGWASPRLQIGTKSSPTDMVSEMDQRAEAFIAGALARLRPDDGILAEEGTGRTGSSGVTWIVDPLDGTTNYLYGLPAWSVSVAAEVEGSVVAGIVLDPVRQERWTAMAGAGAWLNDRPLPVAARADDLGTALVATGFSYRSEIRRRQAAVMARVLPEVRDVRRFGSAALDLCWAGAGRFDAYFEGPLQRWDAAAGLLVAAEAGARTGQVSGPDGDVVVVAGADLYEPLTGLLRSAMADAGSARAEVAPA